MTDSNISSPDPVSVLWAIGEAGDWQGVIDRWQDLPLERRDAGVHILAALALRRLQRFAAADAVLVEGIARFPAAQQLWIDRGWLECERRDWNAATVRFREAQSVAPEHPGVLQGLCQVLKQQQRFADADHVLCEALKACPDDLERWLEWAEIAMDLRDWPLADQRYAQVAERFDDPRVFAAFTAALLRRQEYARADRLVNEAVARHPDDVSLLRMSAGVALQSDRATEALARWQAAHLRHPADVASIVGLVRALTDMGQFDVAQRWLELELPRHPRDPGLREVKAYLATRIGDWPTAVAGWQELVDEFPEDMNLRRALADARRAATAGSGEPPPEAQPEAQSEAQPEPPPPAAERMADMLWEFESLGNDWDFGLLQRYYGAEPLGLLRWAETPPDLLIEAASVRFDGVGEPQNLVIGKWPSGEYSVADRRFHMLMHSFTFDSGVDQETFTRQQLNRGRYLKRKLLEHIENGSKLLIYKSEDITETQVEALNRALKAIGPAWLFVVRLSDAVHSAGTLEEPEAGLLIGYVDAFPVLYRAPPSDAVVAGMTQICERAYDRWKAAAAVAA